jgi:hypothetical protein
VDDVRDPDGRQVVLVRVPSLWVEVTLRGGWKVAYRLGVQDGRSIVSELRVFPDEPTTTPAGQWSGELLGAMAEAPRGGITASLLRKVSVGAPGRFGDEMLSRFTEWLGTSEARRLFGLDRVRPQRNRAAHRGRRAQRPNRFYAELAQAYADAWKAGDRQPIETAAARMGVAVSEARRLVHEARHVRGLLTKTTQGKGGGQLTDEARRILKGGRK